MKVKTCLVCEGHSSKSKPDEVIHEPDCIEGRCAAAHNPGVWPWSARCVRFGRDTHGERHEDKHGNHWQGVWRSVAEGLTCEDPFPLHVLVETSIRGTEWVIKDRDEVTICRSPKRYKDPDEVRESLRRFMDTVNGEKL